jgi:hypothetical protein
MADATEAGLVRNGRHSARYERGGHLVANRAAVVRARLLDLSRIRAATHD